MTPIDDLRADFPNIQRAEFNQDVDAPQYPRVLTTGRFCVLDVETTGLGRTAEIVQIALAQADHAMMGLRGYWTVRPYGAVTSGAQAVHGYSTESLRNSPRFEHIAADLRYLIGDRIILGHNAARFDVPILARQFSGLNIPFDPPVLDTFLAAKQLVPAPHNLDALVERLQVPRGAHHDAWHDCRMTWYLFGALAAQYSLLGALTAQEVVDAQKAKIKLADLVLQTMPTTDVDLPF